jgi:hypothetical protein
LASGLFAYTETNGDKRELPGRSKKDVEIENEELWEKLDEIYVHLDGLFGDKRTTKKPKSMKSRECLKRRR